MMNSHLLNDGVEETSPPHPSRELKSSYELFTNLEYANVGFTHWHPVAVTGNGNKLAGQSEMGGVWEWTSSPLEKYDGFEPMSLYPGYTGKTPDCCLDNESNPYSGLFRRKA
jgi:L-histidine Nalpha-methyltransferase / hercynylcysteine S-oxide synthase